MAYDDLGFLPDPAENPGGIGSELDDKRRMTNAQMLQTLLAQRADPQRDPGSSAQLEQEIARLQKAAAGDDLGFQPDEPVRATQADVRKGEPQPSPMESQREKEARFTDAYKRFVQATGGSIPPGKNIRQAVEEWSGIQDPVKTRDKAETDELAAGGDVQYGDSVPYAAAKGAAALGGFALGGPAGATAGESLVRMTALAANLKKAVDAGAIDQDRAVAIWSKETAKGTAEDAAFNFGLPMLGQIVKRIPGVQWLYDKVAEQAAKRLGGGMSTAAQDAAEQSKRATDKLAASAPTPAAQSAVQELAGRTGGTLPTPGQVTGEASRTEQAARVVDPSKFDKANQQLAGAAEGMRQDLVNPASQPSRQALGEQITQTAEDLQKAVKARLRPTFEAADKLGVQIDFTPILTRAKAALAADARIPGGKLAPQERASLAEMVADLEKLAKPAQGETSVASTVLGPDGKPVMQSVAAQEAVPPRVGAEQALDFISRQKERVRAITADWKPSKYFETIMGGLTKDADAAYATAASKAGRDDIVENLIKAKDDYREMMSTVYDDAVKQALKKNPEDVGRLFWQAGNVSEIQQLHKMLDMATREGAMPAGAATKLRGSMVRGFLAEAVPDVSAAAKWSETLSAKPGLRDTWNTLTSTPGGSQLRGTMEVIEQAAKIAQRDHADLLGSLGLAAIPISRAAGGGVGVSLVTGAFHPAMAAAGLSVDALLRMAATAYTQGNKGVLNTIMRALRANSAGTAAGAKALQEALPEMQKFAAANNLGDIFAGKGDDAPTTGIPGVNGASVPQPNARRTETAAQAPRG